ncbi:hypothetical protein JF50_05275 [Pseudoalteromonas luteoviolacea]|uniref:HTH araC/xylS-type domain-containing protein n=1 Tax=Pseudoalteromonas luteoviolacea TaxID=43657 RepID=A0A0C1QFR5_9GAMM|nr:AraC family transcriptional regulator [Pseudoalteromonas luteoviolacea]KID58125.1 hypothetical protein JF50_05275 [Pseudoalteromonas luteoviolacea]
MTEREIDKPNIWIKTGCLLTYGGSIDASEHRHIAMQVVLPDSNSVSTLNGQPFQGAVIIDSNVPHCLKMQKGWVLLAEPHSALGAYLKERLNGQKQMPISAAANLLLPQTDPFAHFFKIFSDIQLSAQMRDNDLNFVTDARIYSVLDELNRCFNGECMTPQHWRAKYMARKLHLSESRFLHLFSEQVGVAWRPYLLWRRMLCALQAMQRGQNATKAAYEAGFSDSAHLSRTFRSTFGMTIRQARGLFT